MIQAGKLPFVRLAVFMAVTMKNGVFWDVTPCGSCKNRRFGGTGASFIRVTRIGELGSSLAVTSNRRTLRRMLVTAIIVPSTSILVTLMKEALSSCETSVLTRATRGNIPEDTVLHFLFGPHICTIFVTLLSVSLLNLHISVHNLNSTTANCNLQMTSSISGKRKKPFEPVIR
jgi:hypothetical protein